MYVLSFDLMIGFDVEACAFFDWRVAFEDVRAVHVFVSSPFVWWGLGGVSTL